MRIITYLGQDNEAENDGTGNGVEFSAHRFKSAP